MLMAPRSSLLSINTGLIVRKAPDESGELAFFLSFSFQAFVLVLSKSLATQIHLRVVGFLVFSAFVQEAFFGDDAPFSGPFVKPEGWQHQLTYPKHGDVSVKGF